MMDVPGGGEDGGWKWTRAVLCRGEHSLGAGSGGGEARKWAAGARCDLAGCFSPC